jgi:hypothetical protein
MHSPDKCPVCGWKYENIDGHKISMHLARHLIIAWRKWEMENV